MKRRLSLLVLGQSNVANYGPEPRAAGPGAFTLYQGGLVPMHDPLPGAAGNGGSVWTRFAPKAVAAGICDEVVVVCAAQGGVGAGQWAPGGNLAPYLANVLAHVAHVGLGITYVVWHQGERDVEVSTPADRYLDNLNRVIASLRVAGMDAPVFVCGATYVDGVVSDAIRDAQRKIVAPERGIFEGPDTDLLGAAYRSDGVHLNGDGQDAFADMLVATFAAAAAPASA
jgi:hypothetical protein